MTYTNIVSRHTKYIWLYCMLLAIPFMMHARHKYRDYDKPMLVAETDVVPINSAQPARSQPVEQIISEQISGAKIPATPGQDSKAQATEPANVQAARSKVSPTKSETLPAISEVDTNKQEQLNRANAPANNQLNTLPHAPTNPQKRSVTNMQAPTQQKPRTLQDESSALPMAFTPSRQKETDEDARKTLKTMEKEKDEYNIEFNFENADLLNLVTQIEEIFNIRFIPDDIVDPLKQGRKALRGNKISFKTNKPLNKRQAWNLFNTFLNLAGLTITPYPDDPNMYFITVIKAAYTMPTPTYIGVDYSKLPTTDQMIRYVYFVENMTTETLKKIVDALKSSDAVALELKSNRALLLVDKAYNIRELLKIVKELDQSSMPQAMSVMKLRYADAKQVEELYKTLTQAGETSSPFIGPRKQPTSLYFPENTRLIAEPRTNALIILGEKDAIQKVEDFISSHVDVNLDQPYARLHTYQVHHSDAKTIADIMNNVTQFGKETDVGKNGGVRGQDKYLRPMLFVAEPATNRIIVRGYYEDYLKAKEVMDQLDAPQPQVGIEVLILTVSLTQIRQLGTQLRSKQPGINGLLGNNVKFQTSGLLGNGIVQNLNGVGVDRLLGNLVNIVQGAGVGNTVVTFGQDLVNGALSVWGIFQALQSVVDTNIVSNPFLVTTNKTQARISIGEQRRVQTSEILSGSTSAPTFDNSQAFLTVKITPQINSDGMIILDITVEVNDFTNKANTNQTDPLNAQQTLKTIKSNVVVANKEVLALGGLVRTTYSSTVAKTPLLGDIPLLGWLFKNKSKTNDKESLLVLISTRIIDPHKPDEIVDFTTERMADYYAAMEASVNKPDRRDPINRWFFDPLDKGDPLVSEFLDQQNESATKIKQERRTARRKGKVKVATETAAPKTNHIVPKPAEKIVPAQPERFSDVLAKGPSYDVEKDLLSRVKNKKRTSLSLNNFIHEKGRSA